MSISFEHHASEEDLERYSLGVLSEAETEPFEEHLLICPVCQDRLAEMDAFVATTRRAAEKVLTESLSGRESRWRRLLPNLPLPKAAWVSVVAGMAVLLVSFAAIWGTSRLGEVTPVTVLLESARGIQDASGARAPAGKPLVLQLNLAELPRFPSYALELVDWRGQHVLASAAPRHDERVSFRVGKLAAGRYWVRLYDPSPQRQLLREFGLEAGKN